MGSLPVSAVDVVVAVVLLGSAGFAFLRGFVHEVLSIAAWVGAVFSVLYGLPHARPFFRDHIGIALAADAAAVAVLFLGTLLILSILTKAVADRVRASALNSVDSSLGFLFGLARGAVLLCLAYMLALWAMAEPPDWLTEAKTRPWLDRGSDLLRSLAPEGFGAAEAKAKEAGDDARKVMEAERAFRTLTAPQPMAPPQPQHAAPDKAKGADYDTTSRRQMDRLFQSNQ